MERERARGRASSIVVAVMRPPSVRRLRVGEDEAGNCLGANVIAPMELRHLRYFVAVAEELHFRRAAERLHMSQPPLSQQIRQLEEEVGAQLLLRNQHRVELTASGAAFLERAREILDAVEDAARQARRVQRGEVGRLAVGFVGSAMYSFVPELLRAFREHAPDIALRLHERGTTEQLRQLDDGRLDVGFLRTPGRWPGLSFETVLEEQVVVAMPDVHPLAQRPIVRLSDLTGEAHDRALS